MPVPAIQSVLLGLYLLVSTSGCQTEAQGSVYHTALHRKERSPVLPGASPVGSCCPWSAILLAVYPSTEGKESVENPWPGPVEGDPKGHSTCSLETPR